MGLDNGIVVRHNPNNKKLTKKMDKYFEKMSECYEVCYWRKHWELRDVILNLIEDDSSYECYDYVLSLPNLLDIYDYLKSLNKEIWNSWNCIWDWDESKHRHKIHLRRVKKLIKLKKKYKEEIEVLFYDSY